MGRLQEVMVRDSVLVLSPLSKVQVMEEQISSLEQSGKNAVFLSAIISSRASQVVSDCRTPT